MSVNTDRANKHMANAVSLIHGAAGFKSDYVRTTEQQLGEVLDAIKFLQSAAAYLSLEVSEEHSENA